MNTIAVYGSSMVEPGESSYIDSYEVGKALAEAGYAVMTGGYAGVMEAVSRGASEAGGHVIGVTTARIEEFRGNALRPNQWLVDEIRHPTLRERLNHLVLEADGYVCMPGGLGTLHELVTVWELIRVGDIPMRPLVCYGSYWKDMLVPLTHSPYIAKASWDIPQFAQTPQDVVRMIKGEG